MDGPTSDSPIPENHGRYSGTIPPPANQLRFVVLLIVVMLAAALLLIIMFAEYGLIALGIAIGISVLLIKDQVALRSRLNASTRSTASTRHSARSTFSETTEPLPFRQRLADYLHVPESEVLPPRPRPVSSMPFWSAVPLSRRPVVLKSVEFIRIILERIRATVRS
jgi:hypothetical protein